MGNRACAKLAGSCEAYHDRDDLVRRRMKGYASTTLSQPDLMQDLLVGAGTMCRDYRRG